MSSEKITVTSEKSERTVIHQWSGGNQALKTKSSDSKSMRFSKLPTNFSESSAEAGAFSAKVMRKPQKAKKPARASFSLSDEDMSKVKRWIEDLFSKNLIPFEVLDLKLFLVTFCGIDVLKVDDLPKSAYSALKKRHADLLTHLMKVTGNQVFQPDHLGYLFFRIRRLLTKNKRLPAYLTGLLTNTGQIRMGYFINEAARNELVKHGDARLFECTSTTRIQTVIANLTRGKLVYVPQGAKHLLSDSDSLDVLTMNELPSFRYIMTGLGQYQFSSMLNNPVSTMDTSLNWLVVANSYLRTSPDKLTSPFTSTSYTPWEANLRILRPTGYTNHNVYISVDREFIDKYSVKEGNITIRVEPGVVRINNSEVALDSEKMKEFLQHLDFISMQPKTFAPINTGPEPNYQITLLRPMARMASYMRELNLARDAFLSEKKNGIFNVVIVAGKGSGKSSLTALLGSVFGRNLFVEDSDDYGKFLYWMLNKYNETDITALDNRLSEADVIECACEFAGLIDRGEVPVESFLNIISENMIRELPDYANFKFSESHDCEVKRYLGPRVLSMINKVYKVFRPCMRAELAKISNFKTLNQKFFQDGLKMYMDARDIRFYISFLHLVEDNVRRRAANRCVRYVPITNAALSVSYRATSKGLSLLEFAADMCLTMLYEEISSYVTPVLGPVGLLRLFGVVPVLSYSPSIELKLE